MALFVAPTTAIPTALGQDTSGERSAVPVMAWHGQSELGFLRVELWNHNASKAAFSQDLVVKSAGDEGPVTYNGRMIRLPADLKTDPIIAQVFVRSASDLEGQIMRDIEIVAMLSPDGMLRLYVCGSRRFMRACELRPSG